MGYVGSGSPFCRYGLLAVPEKAPPLPLTQNVKIHLIGDIDGNGRVNTGDVSKLNSYLKGSTAIEDEYLLACANVTGGKLNMGDTSALYAHVKGVKPLY